MEIFDDCNTICEQAEWLDFPLPWIRESWKNRKRAPGILMDGAYLWMNWDPILDIHERFFLGSPGDIPLHNPGVKTISWFLPDVMKWKILIILNKKGEIDQEVGFAEAENEDFLTEKSYLDGWRYLGKNTMNMYNRILLWQRKIPDTIYQVNKKGINRIALTEREIIRPNILHFIGLRPRI